MAIKSVLSRKKNMFGTPSKVSSYYYNQLTESQRELYDKMLIGFKSFAPQITIPLRPANEILLIYDSIILDNPKLFYVASYKYATDLYKQRCSIMPEYKYAPRVSRKLLRDIDKYLCVFDVVSTGSEEVKEVFVHDFCLNNFTYDHSVGEFSYTILGPIFNNTAVCEGIAKFIKLAFDYLGINSVVVRGRAKDPTKIGKTDLHAWNIVEIGGSTFHLDVTFDMTLKTGINRYDYFNLADHDIKKDHTISDNVQTCTTSGKDYYSSHSLVANTPGELGVMIKAHLLRGKRSMVIKLANVKNEEGLLNRVIDVASQQYIDMYKHSSNVQVSYNPYQLVFEIAFT